MTTTRTLFPLPRSPLPRAAARQGLKAKREFIVAGALVVGVLIVETLVIAFAASTIADVGSLYVTVT